MNACSRLPADCGTRGTFEPQEDKERAGQVKISAALLSPGSCGLREGSCELRGAWCQRLREHSPRYPRAFANSAQSSINSSSNEAKSQLLPEPQSLLDQDSC